MTPHTTPPRTSPLRTGLHLLLPLIGGALLLSGSLLATEFALDDGTIFSAALIGETPTYYVIMDREGTRTVDKDDVIDIRRRPVKDLKLRDRAKDARVAFRKKRDDQIALIMRTYTKTRGEERPSVVAQLDDFLDVELLPAMLKAVVDKKVSQRWLALERLEKMTVVDAVIPLVLGSVATRNEKYQTRAYDAAIANHKDFARDLYEYAAAINMVPEARMTALKFLGKIDDMNSTPALIATLYRLGLEAGHQEAIVRGFREKPLTLGNTRLTVQLPIVEYYNFNTTVHYKAVAGRQLKKAVIATLEKVTDRTFGKDVKAWQKWWKTEGEKKAAAADKKSGETP